jgi:hypothetical protein
MAGPILFNTEPPNEAEKNQTAQSVAFTTCTVEAEFGRPPPAPRRLRAT